MVKVAMGYPFRPSSSFAARLTLTAVLLGLGACLAGAQQGDTLTLDEALKLAKERNGSVRAAQLDVKAAQSRTTQARADFFPTVTPRFDYNSNRIETTTSQGNRFVQDEGSSTGIRTSWTILDSGQRQFSLLASSRSEAATRYNSQQTLRTTLFTVHEQYYDALRAQELLKVANAQVDRTKLILDQTAARIQVGDAAEKDRLQAEADYLNAKVSALVAKNQTTTAEASLKATIGYSPAEPLPPLAKAAEPTEFPPVGDLATYVDQGLANRADLLAQRKQIESQGYSAKRADRDAGLSFNLGTGFDQNLTPNRLESRTALFEVTFPLFDGGRARAAARAEKYGVEASRADLVQAERTARSEIESAYAEYSQDSQRVEAAKLALQAAQKNYEAAVGSQAAGASNVVEVAIAQSSLVTAESNYIQAIYDYFIADVRLRLVTGSTIPGETSQP